MAKFANVKELKEFLATEEGKKLDITLEETFGETKYTTDGVESFLNTDEGKKMLQPKLDTNFAKGLDTWQKNNLDKIKKDFHEDMSKESKETIERLTNENKTILMDSKITSKLTESGFNPKYHKYIKQELKQDALTLDGDNLIGYSDQEKVLTEKFAEWLNGDTKTSEKGKLGTPKDDILGSGEGEIDTETNSFFLGAGIKN